MFKSDKPRYIILQTMFFLWLTIPIVAHAGSAGEALERAPYEDAVCVGSISSKSLSESSGIAVSRLNSDTLWVMNDSGNSPMLYAVTKKGVISDTFRVSNSENRDWEDIASFRYRGESFLLVADVGDNNSVYDICSLLVLKEPETGCNQSPTEMKTIKPSRIIRFRYEDGPRDCEAVAVDIPRNQILLLSKRTQPPVLYELPLFPSGADDAIHVARRTAQIRNIPAPVGKNGFTIQVR